MSKCGMFSLACNKMLYAALLVILGTQVCPSLLTAELKRDDIDVQKSTDIYQFHELNEIANTTLATNGIGTIMDFGRFKSLFRKRYGSLVEELRRQKIFWSRMLEAAASMMLYASKRTKSFLRINPMGDWTNKEFDGTLLNSSALGAPKVQSSDQQVDLDSEDVASENNEEEEPSSMKVLLARALSMFSLSGESEDQLYNDHRDCLPAAKFQGLCGSCYIFSVVALYEWMYCKTNGSLIKFSEQYILDCGVDAKIHQGCLGGKEEYVQTFVSKFGLDLSKIYPYYAFHSQCPYHSFDDPNKLGYGRFGGVELVPIPSVAVGHFIHRGPILVAIKVPKWFMLYGGGVDQEYGCKGADRGLHSMLLVGDGIENGEEYWLLRNSHSWLWGQNGYYKLSKRASCLTEDAYIPDSFLDMSVKPQFRQNDNYDSKLIKKSIDHKKKIVSKLVGWLE